MTTYLSTQTADFKENFNNFLQLREHKMVDVAPQVAQIIRAVRDGGDAALAAYTQQFDHHTPDSPALSVLDQQTSARACDHEVVQALTHAALRIRSYHEKQLPQNMTYTDETGTVLGWQWNAMDAVGLYVPGGKATYPSSVLMNAIPAKVAGVKRLVMVVPAPQGYINPAVMAAADIAGVEEIYTIGGAQAIAALAYGTQTIQPVDKIVGPGNIYVAEAKRQVFGKVGIDMIAGPSEILVVADAKNDPSWIAADLLSQAEHDADAQSVLITDDAGFAAQVEVAIETLLATLPRAEIARASWQRYGAVIIVKNWQEALPLIDAIAAEHVELAIEEPHALAAHIHHAGAIFLGRYTPEAAGDYMAGPSHVLPTSRTAKFSSGLGVLDFMKRTSVIGCSEHSIKTIAADGALLANTEGLQAHALSLTLRR